MSLGFFYSATKHVPAGSIRIEGRQVFAQNKRLEVHLNGAPGKYALTADKLTGEELAQIRAARSPEVELVRVYQARSQSQAY